MRDASRSTVGGLYLVCKDLYFREKVEIGGVGKQAPEKGSLADDARGRGGALGTTVAGGRFESILPRASALR